MSKAEVAVPETRRFRPAMATLLFWICAAHFYASAALAQDAASDAVITLNMQDVDIRALITTVSEVTRKSFIVDPRVQGNVTVISGEPMNAEKLYEVFLSVLKVHGFAVVPAGEVVKILPDAVVKQQATPTSVAPETPAGDEDLTQIYKLRYTAVQELVPVLRPLLPASSHFAAHPATNTIVFTDTGANTQRLINIIQELDQPDASKDIHVVYLRFTRAEKMAETLSKLTPTLVRPGEGQPSATGRPGPVIIPESTNNALIIQASETQYTLLQSVIYELDVEHPIEGNMHVEYLKFANAVDLVDLLNNVLTSTERPEGTEAPGTDGPRVLVQADETTNALVIQAPDEEYQILKAVIEKLDIRRAQVFVETIIAEIDSDKAADLGVEWQFLQAGDRGALAGSTGFSSFEGGLQLGFINEFIESLTGEIVPNLSVVLRALQTDSDVNILSTPNLLTLDNESAKIIVGQEVPFVTGQFTTDATNTSTVIDEETSTATTSINPFQTIERKDVGVTLEIKPQINEGDTIRLEIKQEVSRVTPRPVEGASDLVTDTRQIEATVQVDDGQIIVLGGLIRDAVIDTDEFVPFLGKIPIIGALFRRKGEELIKTNLMVFLRPQIVRSPETMRDISQGKYEFIQEKDDQSKPEKRIIRDTEPARLPDLDWEDQIPSRTPNLIERALEEEARYTPPRTPQFRSDSLPNKWGNEP